MTNTLNQYAICAAADERQREELIKSQEQTILRTASSACKRFISRSDDEWSVALCAFSKAIDSYAREKGDFLPFAQMVIKRDLIDYYRAEKKGLSEISTAPHVLEGNGEPEEDSCGIYTAVVRSSCQAFDTGLQEELLAANSMLEEYGFRFYDLTECSPHQDKTRRECALVVRAILSDPDIFAELKRKHKLPGKALQSVSGVSSKTIDRYRKYIIMAALILDGGYPHLSEYLKYMKEA